MRQTIRVQNLTHTSTLVIAAIALLGLSGGKAISDDLLGIYVGGSVGQSHVKSDQLLFSKPDGTPLTSPVSVAKSATGWKLFVGLRPISWVGAELAYVDFGNPAASQGPPPGFGLSYNSRVRVNAATVPRTLNVNGLFIAVPNPMVLSGASNQQFTVVLALNGCSNSLTSSRS